MSTNPGGDVEQKLAAILAADVVGYTQLMRADEAGTMAALDAAREIFRNEIESERGRIVDMAGDSVLAVFQSATGAVRAALAVQDALRDAETISGVDEASRMRFRIGVNLGDVMEKADGTVYGDGVNVAAGLESVAEPGGIMVSEDIEHQAASRLSAQFIDAGTHDVKNVPKPIRAFRVLPEGVDAGPATKPNIRRGRVATAIVSFAVITVVAIIFVLKDWRTDIDTTDAGGSPSAEDLLASLPDKPSIAVLPFANLSDDQDQAYFADGLTDDLITDLSKISDLFVIARNSSFTYKNKPTKVQDVAADLGVRYILEGSVRRTGEDIRINAQLIDALTGHHLWAERYAGDFSGIFEFQDKVIAQIVENLAAHLTDDAPRELERVRHRQNQKGDSQGSQKVIQAMSWVKGGQPWMTRPYSEDLRERVVRVVESGTSRNAAAKQFDVSISFVVKLMQRWKQRGTIKADKYGGWKKSKLAPHGDRIRALVMENCDITIDELCVLLAAEGIEAKRSTLGDFLLAQGLSRKKRQPTPPSRSALTSRRREPLGATSNLG